MMASVQLHRFAYEPQYSQSPTIFINGPYYLVLIYDSDYNACSYLFASSFLIILLFSYVYIYEQPAFDHPTLKNHKIQVFINQRSQKNTSSASFQLFRIWVLIMLLQSQWESSMFTGYWCSPFS